MHSREQEKRRIATDYGAESFEVSFTRETDGERTEFLPVGAIIGDECLWLCVAPCLQKPGGIVCLPAGHIEWRSRYADLPPSFSFDRLRTKDHPLFQQAWWLNAQQDCACRVSRRNPAGNYYYLNPFSPGPPFVPPE